jgi:competence protein ComEA
MLLKKSFLLAMTALCLIIAPSFGQSAAKKAVAGKTEAAAGLIDINSADAAALKSVPGIGDAYAAKIIANRPYKGKDEIVKKAGVPQGVYDKIKDKIIAKQK